MGLLQKACETYDAMSYRAGRIYEGEKEPLAPISHLLTQASIEITLNEAGDFQFARSREKEDGKIIIPVTEESSGRTSSPCAHPLCDTLEYVSPCIKRKHDLYIKTLEEWTDSKFTHKKLKAILKYVKNGTILKDLSEAGIIHLDKDGRPKEKGLICWIVSDPAGKDNGRCWEDRSLMDTFIDYSLSRREGDSKELCMVSGEEASPARQHLKGIIPVHGNAKLISANDSSGFTYRGRFTEWSQAASVSYTTSQKAHNALRWLIANQGVAFKERTFLCWDPQGKEIPKVTGSMRRRKEKQNEESKEIAANPTQYKEQLQKALEGWKKVLPENEGVVIAAFDAATTGRLAVTYYNELQASDFLDRLYAWEASCCWTNGQYGIQSPLLYNLVNFAFGTLRNERVETDDRLLDQQLQRLVVCRINKAKLPLDLEKALVEKASHLMLYKGELRKKLLFTACAAIRKYRFDNMKEEWDMALDNSCSDRSYLFGRLLALADGLENSTYSKDDRRETNAMRMQKEFTLRPMAAWEKLWNKLQPYAKRLLKTNPGLYFSYQKKMDEVMNKLSPADDKLNDPLEDIYLLGYSHQRQSFYEKKSSIDGQQAEENKE